MSAHDPQRSNASEDSALVEIVQVTRSFGREIRTHWKLIGIIIGLCLLGSLLVMFLDKTKFQAELTFMVNEDESSKLSGLAPALESLGFGTVGSTSEYNLEKIMELMRSHRIINEALLARDTIDGVEDYLANHFISQYKLRKVWARDKPKLKDLTFTHDTIANFTRIENTGLNLLYKLVMKNSGGVKVLSSEILDMPAIMSLTITTVNEDLSVSFALAIYDRLSRFYIDKATEKQRETYRLVAAETDSLRRVLSATEYELAQFEDQNQNLLGQRARLRMERLEREVLILATMYTEAVANEEAAKFTLRKQTPFIQSIDIPVAPLKRIRVGLSSAVIRGLILGLLLSLGFVIGRKVIRDTIARMPEEPREAESL